MKRVSTYLDFIGFIWKLSGGKIALGLILSIIVGLTEGLSLVLIIPIAASASPKGSGQLANVPFIGDFFAQHQPKLATLLIIFVILIAAQSMLIRVKNLYNAEVLHKTSDAIRLTLFEKIAMSRWETIRTYRSSELLHLLKADPERIITAANNCVLLFHAGTILCVYVILAALISWQMALFASVMGGFIFFLLFPIRRKATAYGKELTEIMQNQQHVVLEFVTSLRLAKLFTIEETHISGYKSYLISLRRNVMGFMSISSLGTVFFQITAAVIAAIFVWTAISVFSLGLAKLGVLLLIFIRLAPRFDLIQSMTQQFLSNIPAYENYKTALERFSVDQEDYQALTATTPTLGRKIQLSNIRLKFEGAETSIFEDLNVSIKANLITTLIGPSGSGKSTFLDLVLGLTEQDEGQILIDETPLDDPLRRAWRSSVACVPQTPFLLNDTIANNLRLNRKEYTDDELWEALRAANIDTFVRDLPDGLETLAGDRGDRFSGGEKQRIALARALLRRPQLLVLDEATSALDWENQKKIIDAVLGLKGQLTVLIVTHDASFISFSDRVIALSDGKIVEDGAYEDLINNPQSALYRMRANG